jgi:hypothetical protein
MGAFTLNGLLDCNSAFTELMLSSESKVVPAVRHPTGITYVEIKLNILEFLISSLDAG